LRHLTLETSPDAFASVEVFWIATESTFALYGERHRHAAGRVERVLAQQRAPNRRDRSVSTPRKYALADWPAPDRAAWHAATATDGSWFARGKRAHWRPETRRQAFYAYARWLAFLTQHDPESLQAAPRDRLTPARLDGFIAEFAQGVTAQTAASTINHLINAVHAVAPDYQTAWLRHAQQRFQRQSRPRDKRPRMVPVGYLYALGFQLMDRPRPARRRPDLRPAMACSLRAGVERAAPKTLAVLAISRDLNASGSTPPGH
jgi:hypothetical protein